MSGVHNAQDRSVASEVIFIGGLLAVARIPLDVPNLGERSSALPPSPHCSSSGAETDNNELDIFQKYRQEARFGKHLPCYESAYCPCSNLIQVRIKVRILQTIRISKGRKNRRYTLF